MYVCHTFLLQPIYFPFRSSTHFLSHIYCTTPTPPCRNWRYCDSDTLPLPNVSQCMGYQENRRSRLKTADDHCICSYNLPLPRFHPQIFAKCFVVNVAGRRIVRNANVPRRIGLVQTVSQAFRDPVRTFHRIRRPRR